MILSVPPAASTVCNPQQEVSEAIAPAHAEAVETAERADVKHADETSWKRCGRTCWLLTAATLHGAAFPIDAKRSQGRSVFNPA